MPTPTDELLDAALRAERLGRFAEARDLLREAAKGDGPLALDGRLRLGKLLTYSGQDFFGEAETVLTAAYELACRAGAPRLTAGAVHLLAQLERSRGRLDAAGAWGCGTAARALKRGRQLRRPCANRVADVRATRATPPHPQRYGSLAGGNGH
jgi:hypothetical protein